MIEGVDTVAVFGRPYMSGEIVHSMIL